VGETSCPFFMPPLFLKIDQYQYLLRNPCK
jgi:hypothetical protein